MKIILNSTDKKALELCHSKTRDVRESDLIKAVLLSSEGWSVSQISQALRKHETTLLRHLTDFQKTKNIVPQKVKTDIFINLIPKY